jgi:hypothetical protein
MSQYTDRKISSSSEATSKQDAMIQFFNSLDVQVVKEIDEFHKIIKYSANRKDSDYESEEKSMKCHLMLVSYHVIKDEKATISMFEYDEEKQCINPLNFMIVSQKINKLKLIEDDM